MEPFTIVGKAKNVFRLIELKARREQELKLKMGNLREEVERCHHRPVRIIDEPRPCPIDPEARCNKPFFVTCEYLRCPVWKEYDGE